MDICIYTLFIFLIKGTNSHCDVVHYSDCYILPELTLQEMTVSLFTCFYVIS